MTTPPPAATFLQPPSRIRSFCVFVVALIYAFVAGRIAHRAASGLSSGDWTPLLEQILFLFLLLVGFGALSVAFRHGVVRGIRAVSGLVARLTALHEFGVGVAVGWGLLLLTILPSVLIGGLAVSVSAGGRQWFLLILDILVLLVAALCSEVIFRGYPFRQLTDAVGPTLASILISICFVVVHYEPDMPRAGIFSLFLLSLILCVAFLRTRALWICWGLHFGWNAAMGPLFGLPLGGANAASTSFSPVIQSVPLGPDALSGGDYGPEGSVVAVLVLCFGLWLILRVTREYAHRYGFPEIVPGGIPVDIDAASRRQHEAAMGPAQPAQPKLVQIGPPLGAAPTPPRDDETSAR